MEDRRFPLKVYSKAKGAWFRRQEGQPHVADALWMGLARRLVFPTIRKKMIGSQLRALICGSAPLAVETQLFFMMLGIPVLQVYGLTETTAICTMDDPWTLRSFPAAPDQQSLASNRRKLGTIPKLSFVAPTFSPGLESSR